MVSRYSSFAIRIFAHSLYRLKFNRQSGLGQKAIRLPPYFQKYSPCATLFGMKNTAPQIINTRGFILQRRYFYIAVALLLPLVLACGLLETQGMSVSQSPPTRTPRPTFTPTLPPQEAATAAPQEAAPAPTDTPAELPADTPTPESAPTETPPAPTPTDTPEPPPTDTPPAATPTNIPPATSPPPPTDTPVPEPAGPVVGQFGVSGKVTARDKTTFSIGEKAFFTYEANNHSDAPVSFQLLGIKASNGQFNTSWINPDTIHPGVPFRHDDGLAFDVPGTYQVFLAICYFGCDGGDAVWEEYRDGAATITVQ